MWHGYCKINEQLMIGLMLRIRLHDTLKWNNTFLVTCGDRKKPRKTLKFVHADRVGTVADHDVGMSKCESMATTTICDTRYCQAVIQSCVYCFMLFLSGIDDITNYTRVTVLGVHE